MKFKYYYFLIFYEVFTFIKEMRDRKAKSIRFELQESVGKVNIYIDDSSFKLIDGKFAWRIVKGMYSYFAKKTGKNESFDKDVEFTSTIGDDDFDDMNKKFKLNLLPLPKGKCITFSYIKKTGSIYEAAFTLTSNNLDDIVSDKIQELTSCITKNEKVQMEYDRGDNSGSKLFEVESISYRNKTLKIFLLDEDEETLTVKHETDKIKTKKEFKAIFSKFKIEKNLDPVISPDVEEEITKISW